jgi:response regulator RpfG family c-di-GMP phosphodiesterase
MLLQEKPDLVLVDVRMPTVSGDTLVKLFSKASPKSGTILLCTPRSTSRCSRARPKVLARTGT